MLKPPINELIAKAGSRYGLVILASKRARQIIEGADLLTKSKSTKPVSLATDEIYNDMVRVADKELLK